MGGAVLAEITKDRSLSLCTYQFQTLLLIQFVNCDQRLRIQC